MTVHHAVICLPREDHQLVLESSSSHFALARFAMLTIILRKEKKIQSKRNQQADFDHDL